jgi:NAD(P)-dependent dehydrogenase (short-subunit alcohol dehydrogenase family)
MAVRTVSRGQPAAEEIKAATNNTGVIVKELDLMSLESVEKFVKEIKEGDEKVDGIVLNAGGLKHVEGPEGPEVRVDTPNLARSRNHGHPNIHPLPRRHRIPIRDKRRRAHAAFAQASTNAGQKRYREIETLQSRLGFFWAS